MKIAIAGLSRSGTTALFYKVKNSLTGEPRLMFEPTRYEADRLDDRRHVLCKFLVDIVTPEGVQSFAPFDKKVLIVRDPRDRMISSMLYSRFHAPYALNPAKCEKMLFWLRQKETDPESISVLKIWAAGTRLAGRPFQKKRLLHGFLSTLNKLHTFITTNPDYFLFKYEEMVEGRFAPLEAYLGFPLKGSGEVDPAVQRVVRTKSAGDWRNWFLMSDVAAMKPIFEPTLLRLGYDLSWDLPRRRSISPAIGSEYVARLFEEQRLKVPAGARHDHDSGLKGKILAVSARRIAGWAALPASNRPAKVRLRVNGTRDVVVAADQFRPQLKKKGMHPSGFCGFVLKLSPEDTLRDGDTVQAILEETGEELENSPLRFMSTPAEVKA